MHRIVIPDTSTLIVFSKIGRLELLNSIYGKLTTTPQIAEEFKEPLPEWILIQEVTDKKNLEILLTQIDPGEASAIALAKESSDVLLLMDDLKARKLARQLNLKITGALGIIYKAKQLQKIDRVKPVIEEIFKTNFHISAHIVDEILKLNNEL
ncbi:DUF3368 domain-containing protein [Zunongwangia sp. H14]|uniref:DUF3368 domain-containing protein n=1 Tax=Zunongwangia sp. H14 TaxID=3240792 RepID=UPI0035627207